MKNLKKTGILVLVILIILTSIYLIEKNKNSLPKNFASKEVVIKEQSQRVQQKELIYKKAKEIVAPDGYLNIDNITIQDSIGKKVILVDFWTYSCINCQRTLPYLNAWYQKYKNNGLIIIGIHTPEFEFEKDYSNVKKAIEKYGVKYPVVQDNKYGTWTAYDNHYWPHKYLIDIDGFIVYDHIGEGSYDQTEQKIQELLQERNQVLKINEDIDKKITNPLVQKTDFSKIGTPEIYFGYQYQRDQIGNKEGWKPDQTVNYTTSQSIEPNKFYLFGDWLNVNDNMELVSKNGTITLRYFAKNVNLVAGSKTKTEISIKLDGKHYKNIEVSDFDLYNVISEGNYSEHTLEIDAQKGLMAYTFTFG